MSFTNFGTGATHAFGGTYVELTPHVRIRYTDRFDDPNLPGEMHYLPSVIPVEGCYLGWQESLSQLAALVEPTIPDEA